MTAVRAGGDRLTAAEHTGLVAWQRRMRIGVVISLALIVVYGVFVALVPDISSLPAVAFAVAAPLIVTGAAIQLTGRCPRCERRVALVSGLGLPRRCARCGVAFEAPERP